MGLMKTLKIVVPWNQGLSLKPSAKLAELCQKFRSVVVVKFGGNVADLRSVLSLLALCAFAGSVLDLEVTGEDEKDAIQAIEEVFTVKM